LILVLQYLCEEESTLTETRERLGVSKKLGNRTILPRIAGGILMKRGEKDISIPVSYELRGRLGHHCEVGRKQ
jgi:hypothetical protein